MIAPSRRNFLKSATAAAAVLSIQRENVWSQSTPGEVQVWSTFRDRRYAAAEPLSWKPVKAVEADAIVIDPSTTKQEILGFGGALTDATCYVISQMKEDERKAIN